MDAEHYVGVLQEEKTTDKQYTQNIDLKKKYNIYLRLASRRSFKF